MSTQLAQSMLDELFSADDFPVEENFLAPLQIRLESIKRQRKVKKISEERARQLREEVISATLEKYSTWVHVNERRSGTTLAVISAETNVPQQTISSWYNHGARPHAISVRHLTAHGRETRFPPYEEAMDLVREYVFGQVGNNLQYIILLKGDDFEKSYRGYNLEHLLNFHELKWHEALVEIFSNAPIKNGEKPALMQPYDLPLRKWMFRTSIKDRWGSVDDRIEALGYLFDNHWGQVPPRSEFFNPDIQLGYSLASFLQKIKAVYGRGSHIVALVEAGCIDSEQFQGVLQQNPNVLFPLAFHDIVRTAFYELLKSRHSLQDIATIYRIPIEIIPLVLNPLAREKLENRLDGVYERFQKGLKRKGHNIAPIARGTLEGIHIYSEDYLPKLAGEFGYPAEWFRELHLLQSILNGRFTPYHAR